MDPAHFLTLPNCQWEALLRGAYTKDKKPVRLELLTDPDMYTMCERGLRGGVCTVGRQKVTHANNPLCPGYDASKPTTHILYLDANNLYAVAMSKRLPSGNFKWVVMSVEAAAKLAAKYSESDSTGYFLEVDLTCPKEQ